MQPAGTFARPPARKILILAAIPAMACLAYWPLRLAWADHLSSATDAETVARAVRLSPGDADLRLKLAAAQQAAGADPTAALEAAAALDHGNADAWTRLGVAAEMRGDLRTPGSCPPGAGGSARGGGRPPGGGAREPPVRAALGACQFLLPPRRWSAFLAVGERVPADRLWRPESGVPALLEHEPGCRPDLRARYPGAPRGLERVCRVPDARRPAGRVRTARHEAGRAGHHRGPIDTGLLVQSAARRGLGPGRAGGLEYAMRQASASLCPAGPGPRAAD